MYDVNLCYLTGNWPCKYSVNTHTELAQLCSVVRSLAGKHSKRDDMHVVVKMKYIQWVGIRKMVNVIRYSSL